MIVLLVAAAVAVAVGGAVGLVALRWPRLDPTAPGGHDATDPANCPGLASPSGGTRRAVRGGRPVGDDVEAAADRVTIVGLSAAGIAAVACATLFGVLVLLVRGRTGIGLDHDGATWSARNTSGAATDVLRLVTHLGTSALAIPLALAVGALEHRRRPNRALFGFLVAVEAGQLLLVNVVKVVVARTRPEIDQLAEVSTHSFPSGHTATAAATFAALALLLGRDRGHSTRAALAGTAAGLAALVASTRVLLGVHWITDVVGGAALGWGWAVLCSIAFGGRLLRFGAAAEEALGRAAPPEVPSQR